MRLATESCGSGRPLVLVHGITESAESFRPLVAPLAERFALTLVDLRGHGRSVREAPYDAFTMSEDLAETLESLGVADPILVGHSLGGSVVSVYAATHGCRGAINVDQPLALGEFQGALAAIEPALRGNEDDFRATMTALFDSMRGRLDDAEWARLAGQRRLDQEVVLGVWSLVLETPAADLDAMVSALAGAVTAPYLALHGTEPGDEYRAWLASRAPAAVLEVWDGLGHYPHLCEPERFVERVSAFAANL